MATLYKQKGSDKWWLRYTKGGKQIRKSTGTEDRGKAEIQLREVELLLGQHKQNGSVSQKLAEALQADTIHPADIATVFEDRRKHVAPNTQKLYAGRDRRFLDWLTMRRPEVKLISDVDRHMVRSFLSEIAEIQQPRTYNGYLRRMRQVFSSAVRDGFAVHDPTQGIDFLSEQESPRRPFTEAELKKLFQTAEGDVRLLTLIGLYAGAMRLSDIVNLKWGDIDLDAGTIRWRMRKRRGKHMEIAIHPALLKELRARGAHEDNELVLPSYVGRHHRGSEAFRKLLVDAGLRKDTRPDNNRRYRERLKARKQCEQAGKDYVPTVTYVRPKQELDFHALRYNFCSELKKQGCPEAIARSIMGHSSVEVNAIYTQIDASSERQWVTSLQDVTVK